MSSKRDKDTKKEGEDNVSGSSNLLWSIPVAVAVGFTAFALSRYRVSSPSQYLVKTGIGIKDMSISKTAYVWPFQQYRRIDMTPHNYGFDLRAMTNEKLEFKLPVLFTIGAKNEPKSLEVYCRYIGAPNSESNHDIESHHQKIEQVIQGIIEGETRVLAAGMSIEDIFKSRSVFKSEIVQKVQEELDKFGLTIYNSNIKELQDVEGSEYFRYLRQKTVEGANNQGIIDVSEAKMKGVVGEKERTGKTRQEVARIESEAILAENERKKEILESQVQLDVKTANADKLKQLARIEAVQATALRQAELEATVNQAKAREQTEKLRSQLLSAAQVKAESSIKEAEGQAEAQKRQADGLLYSKQKEAEGMFAILQAQAEGVRRLSAAIGGSPEHFLQYLMLDKRVYQEIARENAQAIHGLNPQITVWHTDGGASGNDSSPLKAVTDLYKNLPPVLNTVEQLTGMKPPTWLVSKTPDVRATRDEINQGQTPISSEEKGFTLEPPKSNKQTNQN